MDCSLAGGDIRVCHVALSAALVGSTSVVRKLDLLVVELAKYRVVIGRAEVVWFGCVAFWSQSALRLGRSVPGVVEYSVVAARECRVSCCRSEGVGFLHVRLSAAWRLEEDSG